MTHRAVGFGRGFPRIWLIPIGALTVLLGIAASGRLSRSIVADLIAWWPIWLGLAITAFLLRDRRLGAFRVSGLVPLVALVFVGIFIWGHLAGWSIMPSSSQRLVGPDPSGYSTAELTAAIDGELLVTGGSEFLYQIEPVKRGGGIAIPTANEHVSNGSVSIAFEPPPDRGLYVYAGWDLGLSSTLVWSLDLDGAVEADLSEITLDSLRVTGAGTVHLGPTDVETPVEVGGSFHVVVPSGTPARVVGIASVPATWTLTSAGANSPAGGDGWVVTVVGDATLTVSEG
jgi:hypothetical protein